MKIVVLARKPLDGTVVKNVLTHGCGGINVDASRITTGDALGGGAATQTTATQKGNEGWVRPWMSDPSAQQAHAARVRDNIAKAEALGRWPANLILNHLEGCERDGIKKVKTSHVTKPHAKLHTTGFGGAGPMSAHGFGSERSTSTFQGMGDADGNETVTNWVCETGCPVRALDAQSGIVPTGTWNRQTDGAHPFGDAAGSDYDNWKSVKEPEGGASRFFKNIGEP